MNVLHPPFVHFVVALPVAALFAQLTFLATKERTYAKVSLRILAFTLLMGVFAYFTGEIDAEKIQAAQTMVPGGIQALEAHQSFAFWVLAILFATIVIKWIAAAKESLSWEKLALGMILLSIAATLYQGNKGGSLVYKYAAGIDSKILKQRTQNSSLNPKQTKE